MLSEQTKLALAEIKTKPEPSKWCDKTLLGCATVIARNGALNHAMTKDTTKSVEERSARHLVARICEGMVENILGANGATPEGIKVLKNGIMQQMLREKSQ